MSRDCGTTTIRRITPPGMVSALADHFATAIDQMSNQISTLHGWMAISSKDSPAALRASSRFISIASANAS